MKNNKGFSSVALIIIALVVLGGGYWLWENKMVTPPSTLPEGEGTSTSPLGGGLAEVENWKTYRNDEYGFEVKYPSELSTKFNYYNERDYIVFALNLTSTIPHDSDLNPLTTPFFITIIQENKDLIIQDLMKKTEDYTDQKLEIVNLSDNLSGEQIFRRYKNIYPKGYADEEYGFDIRTLITQKPYTYSIGVFSMGAFNHLVNSQVIELYKQILSTFRFTK